MNPERELQLTHYAATGRPMAAIARDLGISRERVRQLFGQLSLHQLWEETRPPRPEPPPRTPPRTPPICRWCGRDGVEARHQVHAACRRTYDVYYRRERYRTDPAVRRAYAEANRRWQVNNPARVQGILERKRERYRTEPAYREKLKAAERERYAQKKAQ